LRGRFTPSILKCRGGCNGPAPVLRSSD
jgi:hypothetical protein